MTAGADPHVQEFVCCECGQAIVSFGTRSEFKLCATCIMLPGWHLDPTLRAKLGPFLPPLPAPKDVHNG